MSNKYNTYRSKSRISWINCTKDDKFSSNQMTSEPGIFRLLGLN